ncbi:MAG TPA: tail fiber protein [Allosphingosinicella sp.]|nr:tail fiber protein [Allosphingosinicella sp.]
MTSPLRPLPDFDAPAPRPNGLAMTQLLDIGGAYPERSGESPPVNTLAMVHSFAGQYPPFGAATCTGESVSIPQNQALTSLIGPAYGGGDRDIDLPDLRGRTPAGADPAGGYSIGAIWGGSLSMTYMICAAAGAGPPGSSPMLGAIGLFAANFAPAGWLVADGSPFSVPQNEPLYQTIGTQFGGNDAVFFELPNLVGRAIVGAGMGPGLAPVSVGELIDNSASGMVSGLGINYLINVAGTPPPSGGNGGFPANAAMLGEVIAFAGTAAPDGWLPCDGALLPVAQNQPLFNLIGTTYGGDGHESFALPDLRGRMLTGPA